MAPSVYTTISANITGMRNLFSDGMDLKKNRKLKFFIDTAVNFVIKKRITGVDIDFERFGEWTKND